MYLRKDQVVTPQPVRFDVPATSPNMDEFWNCIISLNASKAQTIPYGLLIQNVLYKGPINLSVEDVRSRSVDALKRKGVEFLSYNQ